MEVYAEISKKLFRQFEEGSSDWILPDGVKLNRKHGSRACFFECDDSMSEELTDFLDSKGVSWQFTIESQENYRKEKNSGFREMKDPWNNKDATN